MKTLKLAKKVLSDFNLVSDAGAKGKTRQLFEIMQLVARCQFTPDEYYSYRFFEKSKGYNEMLNYMSKYHSMEYFHPPMSDPHLSFLISDKLSFNAYFGFLSLPVTKIYAYYLEDTSYQSDGFLLKNEDELKEMLLKAKPEALVIKPAGGAQGKGLTVLICGQYDGEEIVFYRNNGEMININGLARLARNASSTKRIPGAVIEEKLDQHELLNEINSSSVNTVRLVTLLKKDGAAIPCFSVFRVGRKGFDVDNISRGGLFVRVNMHNGELGEGSSYTKYNKEFFSRHPDSGVEFSGFKIPFWVDVKALCLKAAELAPFCRSIGWDVAITPRGPVLIEGNNYWAMDLQARSEGFLQPEVRKALLEYGLKFPEIKLPGIKLLDLKKAMRRWAKHV